MSIAEFVEEFEGSAAVVRPKRRPRRFRLGESLLGYAFILPALIMIGLWAIYPMVENFFLATREVPPSPVFPSRSVGLAQFTGLLSSQTFLDALKGTMYYTVMVVPIGGALGLAMAVFAHQKLKGVTIYRLIFSSTVATSAAVVSVIFGTYLNPATGLLRWLGVNPTPPLVQNPTWAMPMMALVGIWGFMGAAFILFSAGLQSIPDDVVEAARIDGASAWTIFRRITLPLLSPTIFFCGIVGTSTALLTFQQMNIIVTAGSATQAKVNTLAYMIFQEIFYNNNQGLAACYAIVLFGIMAVLGIIQYLLFSRRVHYGN